jgi:hypothetical protein
MNLSKEEEDFGCDVMEQEEKTTTTSFPIIRILPMKLLSICSCYS